MGLVNEVVAPERLRSRAAEIAGEISRRSPLAIAAMKTAFSSRHNGVSGQARLAHDQYLTAYLVTNEAHEMRAAFDERRPPDPSRFWS
jgi:naphthoate synthase